MRIGAIFRKEVIHIKRDIRMLYFAIFWPVILLLLFGYTVNMDVKNIDVSYIDLDCTEQSRGLFLALANIGSFRVSYQIGVNWQDAENALKKGKYRALIIVPDGFSKALIRNEDPKLQFIIDGSDNNTARILMGYLLETVEDYLQKKINIIANTKQGEVEINFNFLFNPGLRSQNFIVPGLIAIIIMIICTLITSSTISGEWERGTMEQLLYTPVKPYELILGKLLPYLIIGYIQVTLVLLTGIIVFKVPFRGSIILFYIASTFYIFGALGWGLFISLLTKSQQISTMVAFLTSILPAFLLSGFVFPISSMPVLLQIISHLVSAKYFLAIIRNVFLKGADFSQVWQNLFVLLIFSVIFFSLGITKFKKQIL